MPENRDYKYRNWITKNNVTNYQWQKEKGFYIKAHTLPFDTNLRQIYPPLALAIFIRQLYPTASSYCLLRLSCDRLLRNFRIARAEPDGTRAETTFRLSPKRTSPFKSAGESVQSTAGSRGVRICVSNAGYTTFRGRVRVLATHSIRQFPLHFPSRASPCATRFRKH